LLGDLSLNVVEVEAGAAVFGRCLVQTDPGLVE
jgi:hypothetical protein